MTSIRNILSGLVVLAVLIVSCSKDAEVIGGPGPNPEPIPGNGGNGQVPDSLFPVKVKAVVGIGSLIYDSIPASLRIISWDSVNQRFEKQITLNAGANTVLLPKARVRFELQISKWGMTDGITFNRDEMQPGTVISLGGTREAKKLRLVEEFLLVSGNYQPSGKTNFYYNANGSVKTVEYFQKKPQSQDLQLQVTDHYVYQGQQLDFIDRRDGANAAVGYTVFAYDGQGRIAEMQHRSYDQVTNARLQYKFPGSHALLEFYYEYSNGNSMDYSVKVKGGNKVEDFARSSTGGTEGGTYSYDFNINPYAHLNMPDLFLSNLSKNNMTGQQKGYTGAFPTGIPYKYEYTYDEDGYPVQLLKSFKSYTTGEHLFTTKTVFNY